VRKCLIWDGVYDTRKGACNKDGDESGGEKKAELKSLAHDAPLVADPLVQAMRVQRKRAMGLGATLASRSLVVRIRAVSEKFIPVRQNMEILFDISPSKKVKALLLRIYDANGCLAYQEFLDQDEIKALPESSPGTNVPGPMYAKCANRADGPYRVTLWASTEAFPDGKAIEDELAKHLSGLGQADVEKHAKGLDGGKVPDGLAKACKSAEGGQIKSVVRDLTGKRWQLLGAPHDCIVTREHAELKAQLVFNPAGQPGVVAHDQCSAGRQKAYVPWEVGRNLSQVNLPGIRFAAYQVPTFGVAGKGTAYYVARGLAAWKEPGSSDKVLDPGDDAKAKVEHLFEHVIKEADAEVSKASPDGTLRVFLAPEFYFTHPETPYKQSELYTILEDIKKRSADYPEWLIAAGSIWWSSQWLEEKDEDFAGERIPCKKEPRDSAELQKVIGKAAKKNPRLDLLLRQATISRDKGDWVLESPAFIETVRIKVDATRKELVVTEGVVRYKPAHETAKGSGKHEPGYTNVIYNTVPVAHRGRIIFTHQKMHVSTIDGLLGYNDSDQSVAQVLKAVKERRPLDKDKQVWNWWIDELRQTLLKNDDNGIFYVNGLLVGVEVCLDHLETVLQKACAKLHSARAREGADLHLLVAAGMEAKKASVAARPGGLLLRCDGGRSPLPVKAPPPCSAHEWKKGKTADVALDFLPLKNPVSEAIKTNAEALASIFDWAQDGPILDDNAAMKAFAKAVAAWPAVRKKHKAICAQFKSDADCQLESLRAHIRAKEMLAMVAVDKVVNDVNTP
jgi:hypothetical protein